MTSNAEIESIVRRVLARMLAGDSSSANGTKRIAIDASSILRLDGKLITLASIPSDLAGIREVHVSTRAVVTPAVCDLLRTMKATIVRQTASSAPRDLHSLDSPPDLSSPKPYTTLQPLVITGSANFLPMISKSICPKQAKTLPPSIDDATALSEAAIGLRNGHPAAVIIGSSAHAIAWQAGRDEKLRPVVVRQWAQLAEALTEVPANLVILSTKYWNAPAASNVIRAFYKHITQS